MSKTKSFDVPKKLVMEAYKHVKSNRGAAGVDQQSLTDFDYNLKDNLYKIWNRMVSGSYFPPAVRAVTIPKKKGGDRTLGIPTVSNRIAQMVVKLTFEPLIEPYFLEDSYGYRPNKSALDAVGVTRQRCWEYDWVVEFDIKGLFDNIDHTLLMKAVKKHTTNPWVILYIERWLRAPLQGLDGSCSARTKGTPQGGVISPLLANLFLHYAFDNWMNRYHSQLRWARYADDGIVHCRTQKEAQEVKNQLEERLKECILELHSEKTKIVYCKDKLRKKTYSKTKFTFLGYDFRCRPAKSQKTGEIFLNFAPAVSKEAAKSMRAQVRQSGIKRRSETSIQELATKYNPILRGWISYYGRYYPTALHPVWTHFNRSLVKWAMRKYKRLKGRKIKASVFIQNIMKSHPDLFEHWKLGTSARFA